MEFGVFDHLDRNDRPLADFYEARLKLVEAYDRLGFWGYHVAEHHATPLGMAPSPGIYLAAVARATRRLRFGPLVYLLPLYHPLRLIEEICMLDHLSRGRFQLGVGRGISPFEVGYYGRDPAETPRIYAETLELLLQGLTQETLDFAGAFHRFRNVPMELRPLQKPHPPIWLGVHAPASAEAAGRRGFNVMSLDKAADTRLIVERHRAGWEAAGQTGAVPKVGLSRFIVIAESDAEALAAARRAYPKWYASFNHLYRRHGRGPMLGERPADFDAVLEAGVGIAGTPERVAAFLAAQAAETGGRYLVGQFAFGDLTLAESLRSIELFARHVMPVLRG